MRLFCEVCFKRQVPMKWRLETHRKGLLYLIKISSPKYEKQTINPCLSINFVVQTVMINDGICVLSGNKRQQDIPVMLNKNGITSGQVSEISSIVLKYYHINIYQRNNNAQNAEIKNKNKKYLSIEILIILVNFNISMQFSVNRKGGIKIFKKNWLKSKRVRN